ncbi:DNA polymerase III subunit delta' [Legionella maioricensis]|uniref:DNA-directed DNA polymerase n=1 Tax=Legionella maioricensis TaxID=2896528 RepID=A0A9X2D1Q6_9GAMM|nr:DNA polymerase III subunit delta' [Legionella maioricensis]MCL9684573.1 DNA polymerase III subunit delta' [Legionella maioricensis]MCL9687353.1 DNA polymerase III subunit delta' [Legionella maioricensis]
MINHQTQWKQIQSALQEQRIAQSMLFVGPLHCALGDFVTKVMQLFLCNQKANEPCLKCNDCQMIHRMEHPDVEWVKPEKSGGAIKIDQIRELQNSAYLTPQRANFKLIVIEGADRMNTASANALLKILEEPAKHTIFILVAQQLSTVLPTVLSRCQIISFSSSEDSYRNNLLKLGEQYPPESDRSLIISQAESILDGLVALLERREHPCILASQWSQFELSTMLWFLYLVYSQLQYMHLNTRGTTGPASNQLARLLSLLNPVLIFMQIDKINTLLRKISHNMNVNQTLVLEDLLFSLVPEA